MKINFLLSIALIVMIILNLIFYIRTRKEILRFSKRISFIIDKLIEGKEIKFNINNENLLSKLENKFKKLYEDLSLKRNIVKSEKEKIQSLVSDISHQVKTPLCNINLYTETMLYRDLEKEQREKFLKLVLEEEQKLDFLMNALIKTSKLENGIIKIKKEDVNIKELIKSVLESVNNLALNKNIKIINKIKEEIIVVGDNKWLKEAIFNIIENSVKYSYANSNIEIELNKGEIFSSIRIRDFGFGIKKENLNNVFKRFYREEDVYYIKGVGLGLYLSRNIVETLGGFIKLESEKGKGSTFDIYLLNVTKL